MDASGLGVSWVDLAVVALVIVGIVRGRRRGMSQEFLDVAMWMLIVVGAGLGYLFCGNLLALNTPFSPLTCYLIAYVVLTFAVVVIFSAIRRATGEKLAGSDTFGGGEYYLGRVAGGIRYVCIIIFALSLMNARYYSADEIRQSVQYQQDNFGSVPFPTFSSIHQEIFQSSWTGRLAREYLPALLIRSTSPSDKSLAEGDSIVRARERQVDQVFEKK